MRKLLHRVAGRLKKSAASPAIPPNEPVRLAALRRYDVLDVLDVDERHIKMILTIREVHP